MIKTCETCRFSGNNTKYNWCNENPDSPTYPNGSCKMNVFGDENGYWQPVKFTPSDMDLLALESLKTGREVYRKNGKKGVVKDILKDHFLVYTDVFYSHVEEIYPNKPCTDLTKEEVKEHLFEKVWTWGNGNNLKQRELTGYDEGDSLPYCTRHNGNKQDFKHASLTKPENI